MYGYRSQTLEVKLSRFGEAKLPPLSPPAPPTSRPPRREAHVLDGCSGEPLPQVLRLPPRREATRFSVLLSVEHAEPREPLRRAVSRLLMSRFSVLLLEPSQRG